VLDGYYSVTVTLSRVFRRASLVVGIVLAVAFLPVVAEGKGKARAATGKPNILLLLFDDMRYEGVIDNPAVLPKTKRWLADGGVNFTQAFTTTPLCCPNRATMWSGLLMHNHRVFDNYAGDNLDRDWIAPRYLRDAGYGTALVGKFITDWNWRYEPPHFDNLAVFQGGFTDARFMVRHRGEAKTRTERAPYTTDWIGEKAAAFIDDFETSDDQPWFMQVAPHAPHQEQTAPGPDSCNLQKMYSWPPRYDGAPIPEWKPTPAADIEGGPDHKAEKQDKPAWVRSRNFTHKCAQVTYEGAMRTLMPADDMVDLIMTRLQERGELANTLVILTTDNGYAWNERGMTSKGAPWIENVQAPFLVRWDGVFPPGTTDERLVGTVDLVPTYLDAAGYNPPEIRYPFDGRSFLPGRPARTEKYLESGPVLQSSPKGYKGHRGIPAWASLRTKKWSYIETYDKANNTDVDWREYYDLVADPWELNNLLADNDPSNDPDVNALSARLRKAVTCAGTAGDNPCP
jgi:arylsulfatase A-like enzyme